MAERSPRTTLRRPARRMVVLAALSVATFACSPQASDAPATAEAPPASAGAAEPLEPLDGFTVEGEPLDEPTSGPGVRSWVDGDDELDGDLVAAPAQPTAERPPAPNSRPDAPSPASRPPSPIPPAPVAPSTTPASPATTPPTSPAPSPAAPTTSAPTTSSPTTSTPPAPDAILASADAVIATALEDGLISAGTAVALSAKVDTALAALATDGPTTSACGAIGALLGLLSAQDGKEVPTALADQLIAVALAASAALAC